MHYVQWWTVLIAGCALGFAAASFLYGPRVSEAETRALIAESDNRAHAQMAELREMARMANVNSKTALSTIDEFVAQQRAYRKEAK